MSERIGHREIVEFLRIINAKQGIEAVDDQSLEDLLAYVKEHSADLSPSQKESFAYLRHELNTPAAAMKQHVLILLSQMERDDFSEKDRKAFAELIESVGDFLVILQEELGGEPH